MLHAGWYASTVESSSSPREPGAPYRICLVSLGNICRSPMAETVLRAELAAAGLDGAVVVDSAGTGDWHVGEHDGSRCPGRAGQPHFERLGAPGPPIPAVLATRRDLILAMDARNLADLRRMARSQGDDRIRLFGEVGGLSKAGGGDIPDPWGGGADEFGHVLDLLSAAAPVIAGRLARLLEPDGRLAAAPRATLGRLRGRAPRRPVTSFTSGARQVARQTGLAVREARVVGSQHGYQHLMITLAGGRRAFAKVAAASPAAAAAADPVTAAGPATAVPDEMTAAFAAEASSLRWLAEADAVPVPEVLAVTEAALVISMIPPGHATPSAAFRFGTELARLHAAGVGGFRRPVARVHRQPAAGQHARVAGPAGHWARRRAEPRGTHGRSGTRAAGCCPTCAGRWTPARCGRMTAGWWRR